MNARFREEAAGLVSEALAEMTRVIWNPITDEASINFDSYRYLKSGDEYITRMEGDSGVSITGEEVKARSYEINGKVVTGEDVNIFIRLLYDELYNEQYGPHPEEEEEEGPEE